MFTVIYSFKVKTGQEAIFQKAWADLTKLIYESEGSLGSRLHHVEDDHFIAYAQWPNKERWENAGNQLPTSAKEISKNMKDACDKIETLYKMEVVEDLLKSKRKDA